MGRTGPRRAQMGVALDDAIRAHLDRAAEAAGHSVAEEIRRRLESTIKDDARSPELQALLSDIEFLARLVMDDTDLDCSRHPIAFEIFKAGIIALLDQHKPEDDGDLRSMSRMTSGVSRLSDSDDPGTIGRVLARHIKREKLYLGWELQQQKEKGESDGSKKT
jgi:hypothetical protein